MAAAPLPPVSATPPDMERIEDLGEPDDYEKLAAYLEERLYEFNVEATGHAEARYLGLAMRDSNDDVVAGAAGHTWHHTCFLGYVWVAESCRGKGLGSRLMRAVEHEARARGCRNIVLSTHSFQSPEFYERMGFQRAAEVRDHPVGHANIWFTKVLGDG